MPMTAARRRYSLTVDRFTPTVTAICRSLTRARAAISGLLEPCASALSPRASDLRLRDHKGKPRPRFDRRQRELQITFKGWLASIGIGGRLPSESVAGLLRNQWPLCVGLRMMGEPSLNRRHFPVRQERHDMSSLEVAHDRSITVISPEGPVVDTNHVQRLGAWASSSAHNSKDGVVA